MEENTVELIDYLRVIWKRKILIIVVTLVGLGIGAGVGVTNSRSKVKPPVKYCAEVIIEIGKKVNLTPFIGIASSVDYIQSPANLVTIIPLKYWPKVKDISRYHIEVERVGLLSMLKIIVKGHDKGVERGLKELVDMLIDEHRRKAKNSVVTYKSFMKKLEMDAKRILEEIAITDASIKEMKRKEGEYLVQIEAGRSEIKEEKGGGDRSAFLNMLYLKTIDKEKDLSSSRQSLRSIQWQLIMHKITLGNLEEYSTEMVGEINITAVEPKKMKKKTNHIITAGVAGLIMSLFIAFFMEYIEESKSRRKGK